MEMHRACRLVVDTGLHAFNWTQQRAADYLAKYVAMTRGRIEVGHRQRAEESPEVSACRNGVLVFVGDA